MAAPPDLSGDIKQAAQGPQSTSVDGLSVTDKSVAEKIAADQYLNGRAVMAKKTRGIRYSKMVPPGACSDAGGTRGANGGFSNSGSI